MWLNFRKLTKSFAEPFLRDFLWFQRAFLLGNININTLAVLFSFFISNLTCCIFTNKIYIRNRFIAICHTPLYCLIPIFPLKCCQNSQKIERTYLKAPDLLIFCYLEAVRASSSCFCVTKYMQFSKPVDKVGGEMSSIHIRHALPARIRTFFYNGVA